MGGQPIDRGVPIDEALKAHRRVRRRAALEFPLRVAGLLLLAAGVLYGVVAAGVVVVDASNWFLEGLLFIAVAVWGLSAVARSRVGRVLHLSWLAEFLGGGGGTSTGSSFGGGGFGGGDCGGGDGGGGGA